MIATTLALAVVIGLLLGLLGGGGSILTVPMLVYVLHVEPKIAIVTSFVVVGVSSLMAIIPHARKRHVCWSSGALFGLAGMVGAFGGGRLAGHLSNDGLMALFGLVTLVSGLVMLRPRPEASPAQPDANLCPLQTAYPRLLFDGFFVGGLTGLVGVGGGFLIVPALTLWVGLPMQAAIGTSLLVIVMNAAAGLGGYINHAAIDLPLTGIVTAGAVCGSAVGAWLSTQMSARLLRRMFGVFVIAIGVYVLVQSVSLPLLNTLYDWLRLHVEFVLGIAALALIQMLARISARIHQPNPATSPGQSGKVRSS